MIRHLRCGLEIHLGGFFDKWIDDVRLPALFDLAAHELVDLVAS
jgi:hypothetical protein